MDISRLKIGILHSLIGKNDGVSIVIDQTLKTMVKMMDIPLGNIYYLAGHSPPRLNTTLDDVFWHRSEANRYILSNYSDPAPKGFDKYIAQQAKYAKDMIAEFIESNELDIFIVHNGCHPSNFIYSVACGMYFQDKRKEGVLLPKYLLWWHDSHYERRRFSKPSKVIQKYLKYIPGPDVDGIVFINTEQPTHGKKYLKELGRKNAKAYFDRKTTIIPNTCDIPWDWEEARETKQSLVPPQDQYNQTFLKDIGLTGAVEELGYSIDDTVILLQHTRVVERKRIDVAIEFAFRLHKKFSSKRKKKCIALLISGHSGDEHDAYRIFLENYFKEMQKKYPKSKDSVVLIFGEHLILPNREVIVNRKFYQFSDVPSIVAACGGMGTYFSEVEGFGNNLLEMMAMGLPVILNEYDIYKSDVKPLKFKVASINDCKLSDRAVTMSYEFLTNKETRHKTVLHNLEVLDNMLSHKVLADKLKPLINNMFKYR